MEGKWERNFASFGFVKKWKGNKILVLVKEGKGEENNIFVCVGRKKGRKKLYKMSKN